MAVTSLSLLERLQRQPNAADWQRLTDIYLPLIQSWLARTPGLHDEASDVAQEVMIVLVREIPGFQRQREGSFRKWLRLVTVNRVRQYCRERARRPRVGLDFAATDDFLALLADPSSELAEQWNREHDRMVFDRLLAAVKSDFQPQTWEAFRRFAIEEASAAEVSKEFGISPNAVVLAKARVLQRLREEAGAMMD